MITRPSARSRVRRSWGERRPRPTSGCGSTGGGEGGGGGEERGGFCFGGERRNPFHKKRLRRFRDAGGLEDSAARRQRHLPAWHAASPNLGTEKPGAI